MRKMTFIGNIYVYTIIPLIAFQVNEAEAALLSNDCIYLRVDVPLIPFT